MFQNTEFKRVVSLCFCQNIISIVVKGSSRRLRKTNHATSVFASTSDRIRIAGTIDKDIPPPGSYNVESSYHESQGKSLTIFPMKDCHTQIQI